ncbi:MAG: PqqD family protein [Acidimicrobiales bacterium]|nr:MAG: PqqD family protein [Acidimicrobiales bacterium]
MTELDLTATYQQSTSDVHERSIGGVTVLHRSTWDEPMVLNETLHAVWTCLAIGGSAADIAEDIVAVFGFESESVGSNVNEALAQLHELELIEKRDSES